MPARLNLTDEERIARRKEQKRLASARHRAKNPEYERGYKEEHKELAKEQRARRMEERGEDIRKTHAEQEAARRAKSPEKQLLSRAKTRAKQKGLPFDIELEDIVIPETCPYLEGFPIYICQGPFEDNSPSLDRIVPELGYVKGNVRVISNAANMMKRNATPEMLLAFRDGISRLHG